MTKKKQINAKTEIYFPLKQAYSGRTLLTGSGEIKVGGPEASLKRGDL